MERMELTSAVDSQHKSFHIAQHCANEALMTGIFVEQLGLIDQIGAGIKLLFSGAEGKILAAVRAGKDYGPGILHLTLWVIIPLLFVRPAQLI